VDRPRTERRTALLFAAPLLVVVTAFVVVPVLGTLVDSLFRDVSFLERSFVGLDNYRHLAESPGFRQALVFTVLFVLVSVPLEVGLGLGVALLLQAAVPAVPGRAVLRAAVLIPWAIPAAVSARVFELIYDPAHGLAGALGRWLAPGGEPASWLGSPAGAFAALVAADAWRTTPFAAIILLAGLAAIPDDLHRQARVDGAHLGQRFLRVTLPLLRPVLVVAALFRAVDAARVFDVIFVLTGGGPGGATTSVSLYAYRAFVSADFGHGAAASAVLFALSFGLALLLIRAAGFRGEAA
jgi:multiple sugar transport system permease protein